MSFYIRMEQFGEVYSFNPLRYGSQEKLNDNSKYLVAAYYG